MRKKKSTARSHMVEIVVVLLIFAIMAVANALSGAEFTQNVSTEIALAKAEASQVAASNFADAR